MTILRLKYTKAPTESILKRELVDATLLMLAGSSMVPKTSMMCSPSEGYTALRKTLWEGVKNIVASWGSGTTYETSAPALQKIRDMPALTIDTSTAGVIQMEIPEIGATKYKSIERLRENEAHKFLITCQALSSTKAIALPRYGTPILKSNFNTFVIKVPMKGSKTNPNLLYLEVPRFILDICDKHFPMARVSLAHADFLADAIELERGSTEEIEAPW